MEYGRMRKFMTVAVVGVALALGAAGTASAATQIQSAVSGALQKLKFLFVPDKGGKVGGPQKLKITKEVIEMLKKLEGKEITVDNDGQIYLPGEKIPDGDK